MKIIGGSDGKLIILIFLTHPLKFLSLNFIFTFFLLLSVFYVLMFMLNLVQNTLPKQKESFICFFNSNLKFSITKRIYIKGFFKFSNFLKLNDMQGEKNLVKSLYLIFNIEQKKIQILVQFRPPLIIFVILSYFIIYFLKLAV